MANIGIGVGGGSGGGGGGTVTTVTGTFPIVITGGATVTPNVTIAGVYQRMVTQIQTLASGSGLIPGLIYQITNAYSSTAVINIKAFSTSVLEDYGFGTYNNGTGLVNCFMWYDLNDNVVYRVYEPTRNNDVRQTASVSTFNFSASQWTDNTVNGTDFTSCDPASTISKCVFTNSGSPTISATSLVRESTFDNIQSLTVGTDCVIQGSTICSDATLSMDSASEISNCHFGEGSINTITAFAHSLSNCTIGAGRLFDLSGLDQAYAVNGKTYIDGLSTFIITYDNSILVNPDGVGNMNMILFSWAGVLKPNSNSNDLVQITGMKEDHPVLIAPACDAFNIVDEAVSGGSSNIYLEVQLTTLSLNGSSNGDFIQVIYTDTLSRIIKTGGYIRT